MRRVCVLMLLFCVVAGGCTGSDADAEADPGREEEQAVEYEAPPRRAKVPRIKSPLSVGQIRKCLHKERTDISTLGPYYSDEHFVEDQVEFNREIDFTAPTNVQMVSPAEFSKLLARGRGRIDPKDERINQWLEWALGYRSVGSDGSSRPTGDGADLVAGYYVPKTQEVVVKTKGDIDVEYVILAHEFAHAAVDQVFGIPSKGKGRVVDDPALARSALVEGDATLTEYRFSSRFGTKKAITKSIKALLENDKQYQRDRDAGVPRASMERFIFPYRWGIAFACSVYRARGWKGLDAAYRRPPTSTAEIMYPERFLKKDRPGKTAALTAPGKPWKLFAQGAIGAQHLKTMFEAPADNESLGLSNPHGRAAAWDGGAYKVWAIGTNKIESVVGVSFAEHKRYPKLLCSSLIKWWEAGNHVGEAVPVADGALSYTDSNRTAIIGCKGRDVRLSIAPTMKLAKRVLDL